MTPGRPKLPPERKRTIRKEVRLSTAEYDRLCRVALKMRMDVSQFMRHMILTPDPIAVRIKTSEHV